MIICSDRYTPCMNRHIKDFILYKDYFSKTFKHNKSIMFHLFTFVNLQNYLNQRTKSNHLNRIARKFNDRVTINKCVWSFRSSHPEVFLGKAVLKICSKFSEQLSLRTPLNGCFFNFKGVLLRLVKLQKEGLSQITKCHSIVKF